MRRCFVCSLVIIWFVGFGCSNDQNATRIKKSKTPTVQTKNEHPSMPPITDESTEKGSPGAETDKVAPDVKETIQPVNVAMPVVPGAKPVLMPPPLKIPSYPDGKFQFWFLDNRYGMPVGFHKIDAGQRIFREHVVLEVNDKRVTSVVFKDARGRVLSTREYDYKGDTLIPGGFRVLNKMGTHIESGTWKGKKAQRLEHRSTTGESLLDGCAQHRFERNDEGFAVVRTCLDDSGNPAPDASGVVTLRFKRNDIGQVVEYAGFDDRSHRIENDEGVHKEVWTRNLDGAVQQIDYFDSEDRPVYNSRLNSARAVFLWSPKGLLQYEEYRGLADEPVLNAFGVNRIRYEHTADGLLKRKRFLDRDDRPTTLRGTTAQEIAYGYNDDHFLIRRTFWKEEDRGATDHRGVHQERYEVNAMGDIVSVRLFGSDFMPYHHRKYPHRTSYEYLPNGLVSAVSYWNEDGKQAYGGRFSVHREERIYDSRHRVTTRKFNGLSRTTQRIYGKVGAIHYDYNEHGHWVRRWFVTDQGATLEAPRLKYAALVREYDLSQRPVRECFKDGTGNFVDIPRTRYQALSGFTCRHWQYGRFRFPEAMTFTNLEGEEVLASVRTKRGWISVRRVEFVSVGSEVAEERFYSEDERVPALVWKCGKQRCLDPFELNR